MVLPPPVFFGMKFLELLAIALAEAYNSRGFVETKPAGSRGCGRFKTTN